MGMGKLSNSVRHIQYISPNSNSAATFNSKATFKYGKRQNFVGRTYLMWTAGALSGATNPRFVNYAGFRSVGKVESLYQSKDLQILHWNVMHPFHKLLDNFERQTGVETLVGGGLDEASRITAAGGSQTFIIKLPLFYTWHPSKFVLTDALSHEMELDWTIPSLGELTQSDNAVTPTGSISDVKLRIDTYHVDEIERDYHIDRTLTDTGIIFYAPDYEYLLDQTPDGSGTSRTLNIQGLRGSVYDFRFVIRDPTNVTSPGTADNLPTTYVDGAFLNRWRVTQSDGSEIINWTSSTENIFLENTEYHSAVPGTAIYGVPLCFDPEDYLNSTNHDSFSNFSIPTVEFEFSSDPGSIVIDIFTMSRNTWQIVKGDILRNFR